jgi:hypothetical protein
LVLQRSWQIATTEEKQSFGILFQLPILQVLETFPDTSLRYIRACARHYRDDSTFIVHLFRTQAQNNTPSGTLSDIQVSALFLVRLTCHSSLLRFRPEDTVVPLTIRLEGVTQEGISMLKKLDHLYDRRKKRLTASESPNAWLDDYIMSTNHLQRILGDDAGIEDERQECWSAVDDILGRSYFERTCITQELAAVMERHGNHR